MCPSLRCSRSDGSFFSREFWANPGRVRAVVRGDPPRFVPAGRDRKPGCVGQKSRVAGPVLKIPVVSAVNSGSRGKSGDISWREKKVRPKGCAREDRSVSCVPVGQKTRPIRRNFFYRRAGRRGSAGASARQNGKLWRHRSRGVEKPGRLDAFCPVSQLPPPCTSIRHG